jgi:cytochrome c oxidase subunit 4
MMHARVGPSTYLWTLIALVVLAATSFGFSYLDLGPWEFPIALGIAAVKALLVALFFMHLVEHTFSSRLAIVTASVFVVLLISLVALDVTTRRPPPLRPYELPARTQ